MTINFKDNVWMFICACIIIGAWLLGSFPIDNTDNSTVIEIEDKGTETTIFSTKYFFYWNNEEDYIEVSEKIYNDLEVGDYLIIAQ